MRTIHKYQISARPHVQLVATPKDWEPLSVQAQGNCICIWALVDTDSRPLVDRCILVVATGEELPEDAVAEKYLGTAQFLDGGLVWHVFSTLGHGV
jgi:hypothetical protein